jgi:hypothetical protein
MSSYIDLIPTDVLQHILEFNAEHRELFKETLEQIEVKGILSTLNEYERLDPFVHLTTAYYENIADPGYFVHMLSKCKCCERHARNRPTSINDEVPESDVVSPFQVHTCMCTCRNRSRWIIRSFWYDDEDY